MPVSSKQFDHFWYSESDIRLGCPRGIIGGAAL